MTDILMCGENPIGQVSEYTAGETIKSDSIAPVESLVSLHAYAKDDLLVYNGELYIATSAIAVGDTITSKIERTSTTSYVNPTRMNHIEDGIANADLTGGGTITGTLNISGNEQIYRGSNRVNIYPSNDLSANRDFILPDRSGIAAVVNRGWDVEFGQYNLEYNSQTVELTGIKMTNTYNNRYFIIGSVLSGSVLGGRLVVYNSWNSAHWVIVAPQ